MEFWKRIKKYIFNTGYLFLDKCFRALLVIFVWSRVFKFLGPAQLGIFSLALCLVAFVDPIAELCFGSVIIKRLVDKPADRDKILGSSFVLQLLTTILSVVILGVITSILSLDSGTVLIVFCMSLRLIFQLFKNVLDYYFQSEILAKHLVMAQSVAYGLTMVSCFLLIFFKMPLICFALVVVGESMASGCLLILFYHQSGHKISSWNSDWQYMKGLAVEAWPLVFMGISWAICEKIDQVMIKKMLGDVSLGYYAAAVRVSEATYFIPVMIVGSLFPAIVRSKTFHNGVYEARIQSLTLALFLIAVSVSVIFTIFSREIIYLLFGDSFAQAAPVVALYVWTNIFIFLGYLRNRWAVNENLQVYMMVYACVGAIVNTTLNFVLIPLYSIEGAAIATLISYFVIYIVCNLFSSHTRGFLKLQLGSMNLLGLAKNKVFIKTFRPVAKV